MRQAIVSIMVLVLSLALSVGLLSCASYQEYDPGSETSGLETPPPWEQTRGIGSEQNYYYYPQVKIFYNLDRKVYYYFYEGQWQVASQLPANVKAGGRRVRIRMGEEEPYKWQEEVEKMFPPESK